MSGFERLVTSEEGYVQKPLTGNLDMVDERNLTEAQPKDLIIGEEYLILDRKTNEKTKGKFKEVVTMDGSKAGELTLFFATWCPACKSIKPEWDQFRNDYSNKKINGAILLIREVDCSEPNPETEDIMNQYNITGFPTVKLTYNGKIIELQQKPTYDNLVKFVNSSL